MFSALLLVCSPDFSACESRVDMNVYLEEEACYAALAEGMKFFEEMEMIIVGYDCYMWTPPKGDPA